MVLETSISQNSPVEIKSVMKATVESVQSALKHLDLGVKEAAAMKPACVQGDLDQLSAKVQAFVNEGIALCQPSKIHIVDGSEREMRNLLNVMQQCGMIEYLPKYRNCYLAKTDPLLNTKARKSCTILLQ
ncbi:phosphoenolpyruvate carboxykinase [GTP] [Hyalella azteca]|uniref:Phosphoenolpyruvate carboxykinase [GTP] n=1 Tax=Hyalella azteca TaxID=294128 RepID=A0A979FWH3_HYAAZ|nr:phosphoenolpyruvate carboxykinase [GTP] [Hyalella azteca]